MSTNPSLQKFRPYFTASQLLHVISCSKSASPPDIELIRYLEGFAIKIERGVIEPAITNRPSLIERMGLADPIPHKLNIPQLVTDYNKGHRDFSPPELEAIHTYRWENDLMSPEESQKWEAQLFVKDKS